jgi:hypothetical protein
MSLTSRRSNLQGSIHPLTSDGYVSKHTSNEKAGQRQTISRIAVQTVACHVQTLTCLELHTK